MSNPFVRRTPGSFPSTFAIALLLAGAVASAGLPDDSWRLDNGLRAVVAATDSPGVEVSVLVEAGWARDPADALGTAEVAAAGLAWGTPTRSHQEISRTLDELTATLDTRVARDYVTVNLSLADPQFLGDGLTLLAHLITQAGFLVAEIDVAQARATAALLELPTRPTDLALRALPVLTYGAANPAAGMPNPWRFRQLATTGIRQFHAAHYRPERTIVAVAGALPSDVRQVIATAFGGWQNSFAEVAAPVLATADEMPRIGVIEADAEALFVTLGGAGGLGNPIDRYFLASIIADQLGQPYAAGSPLAASGLEVLRLEPKFSPAKSLGDFRAVLAKLAKKGPSAELVERVRERIEARFEVALASDRFRASWLALTSLYRIDPALAVRFEPPDGDVIRAAAERLVAARDWRAVGLGPKRVLLGLRSDEGAIGFDSLAPLEPAAAKAVERGREILVAALDAQGGIERLAGIRSLYQTSYGLYYAEEQALDTNWRLLTTPPDAIYFESSIRDRRHYIVNRVVDGHSWTDRTRIGTLFGDPVIERLLVRQVLRHPVFALIRPYQHGLVRWLRTETGVDGGDVEVIELLDPEAGIARCSIRSSDRALVRLEFDLMPLEQSVETHEFGDFVYYQGVRLPLADEVAAEGQPLWTICHHEIAFPDVIDPAVFWQPGRPSRMLRP